MQTFIALCLLLATGAWAQNEGFQYRATPYFEIRNPAKGKPSSSELPLNNNNNYNFYYHELKQQQNNPPFIYGQDYTSAFYQNQFEGGNPYFIRPVSPSFSSNYEQQLMYPKNPYEYPVGIQSGFGTGTGFGFLPLPVRSNQPDDKQPSQDNEDSSVNKNNESSKDKDKEAASGSNSETSSVEPATADEDPSSVSPSPFPILLPTKMAMGNSGFTNAHHYPFPQGLMRFYYQQTGANHNPQPNRQQNFQPPMQYIFYMPGSSYPYLPMGGPMSSFFANSFKRGSNNNNNNNNNNNGGPFSEAFDDAADNEQRQTGKQSGDEPEVPDDESKPTRIDTVYLQGYEGLGPLYIPRHSNSRV